MRPYGVARAAVAAAALLLALVQVPPVVSPVCAQNVVSCNHVSYESPLHICATVALALLLLLAWKARTLLLGQSATNPYATWKRAYPKATKVALPYRNRVLSGAYDGIFLSNAESAQELPQFEMTFDENNKVSGQGKDAVGDYTLSGHFEFPFLRVKRKYAEGTGNRHRNKGHIVEMDLVWVPREAAERYKIKHHGFVGVFLERTIADYESNIILLVGEHLDQDDSTLSLPDRELGHAMTSTFSLLLATLVGMLSAAYLFLLARTVHDVEMNVPFHVGGWWAAIVCFFVSFIVFIYWIMYPFYFRERIIEHKLSVHACERMRKTLVALTVIAAFIAMAAANVDGRNGGFVADAKWCGPGQDSERCGDVRQRECVCYHLHSFLGNKCGNDKDLAECEYYDGIVTNATLVKNSHAELCEDILEDEYAEQLLYTSYVELGLAAVQMLVMLAIVASTKHANVLRLEFRMKDYLYDSRTRRIAPPRLARNMSSSKPSIVANTRPTEGDELYVALGRKASKNRMSKTGSRLSLQGRDSFASKADGAGGAGGRDQGLEMSDLQAAGIEAQHVEEEGSDDEASVVGDALAMSRQGSTQSSRRGTGRASRGTGGRAAVANGAHRDGDSLHRPISYAGRQSQTASLDQLGRNPISPSSAQGNYSTASTNYVTPPTTRRPVNMADMRAYSAAGGFHQGTPAAPMGNPNSYFAGRRSHSGRGSIGTPGSVGSMGSGGGGRAVSLAPASSARGQFFNPQLQAQQSADAPSMEEQQRLYEAQLYAYQQRQQQFQQEFQQRFQHMQDMEADFVDEQERRYQMQMTAQQHVGSPGVTSSDGGGMTPMHMAHQQYHPQAPLPGPGDPPPPPPPPLEEDDDDYVPSPQHPTHHKASSALITAESSDDGEEAGPTDEDAYFGLNQAAPQPIATTRPALHNQHRSSAARQRGDDPGTPPPPPVSGDFSVAGAGPGFAHPAPPPPAPSGLYGGGPRPVVTSPLPVAGGSGWAEPPPPPPPPAEDDVTPPGHNGMPPYFAGEPDDDDQFADL